MCQPDLLTVQKSCILCCSVRPPKSARGDFPKMIILEYLRPRLVGLRFEGHSNPLEFLRDLSVLEEMVVEVAKWKFFEEHPNRKRSPRGFTDGITLALSTVEDGSAVPVITLMLASMLPQTSQVYFERAREAIVGAISAAAENRPATAFLPDKALAYFDRLGRSLRNGEAIEFPSSVSGYPYARLTREVRRRLLLASAETKVVTEEIQLRGAVHEANQETMTFQITLPDGGKIPGNIPRQHFDDIMKAFNGYKVGVKIFVQGVGQYTRWERLQRIETIEHVTLLDPQDISARLEELKVLKNGWLDGSGVAPPPAGLDWLGERFESLYAEELPLPYVYPVAEGGVRLEWSIAPREVSLQIDLGKESGEWHSLDMDTDAEESLTLNLDDDDAWGWLVRRLSAMVGDVQRDR